MPGGFKPPHAGHYNMSKWLAANTDADTVIVKVGAKEREGITREMSLKLWDLYRSTDSDPASNKLTIIPSKHNSPVKDVYDFIENDAPEGSTIYLAMGEKELKTNDQRFANIHKVSEPRNINFETKLVPPQVGGVSGTDMRDFIKSKDEYSFYEFIPDHLTSEQKEQAWQIVTTKEVSDWKPGDPVSFEMWTSDWNLKGFGKEYDSNFKNREDAVAYYKPDKAEDWAFKSYAYVVKRIPSFGGELEEDLYNPEDKVLDYMRGNEWKAGMPDGPKDDIPRTKDQIHNRQTNPHAHMSEDLQTDEGNKKLRIYDFDDTLAVTRGANIKIKHSDGSIDSLDPGEYAIYEPQQGDTFDFTEFDKIIKDATPIQHIVDLLKSDLQNITNKITILTARLLVYPVRRYLKSLGLDVYVIAVGSSDPQLKADYIEREINKGYDDIVFIDDSPKNLEAVNTLKDKYPEVKLVVQHPNELSENHTTSTALINDIPVPLETMNTPELQMKGMMGRNSLEGGMLFPYDQVQQRDFHMKNCKIPLDIIFINQGKINNIHSNCPPCKQNNCPNYSGVADNVLEFPGGYCQQNNINVGDPIQVNKNSNVLNVSKINESYPIIKKPGFNIPGTSPTDFGRSVPSDFYKFYRNPNLDDAPEGLFTDMSMAIYEKFPEAGEQLVNINDLAMEFYENIGDPLAKDLPGNYDVRSDETVAEYLFSKINLINITSKDIISQIEENGDFKALDLQRIEDALKEMHEKLQGPAPKTDIEPVGFKLNELSNREIKFFALYYGILKQLNTPNFKSKFVELQQELEGESLEALEYFWDEYFSNLEDSCEIEGSLDGKKVDETKYGAHDSISQHKDKIQSDYGPQKYRDLQLMISQQKDEEVNNWLKSKGYINEVRLFSKDWWSGIINEHIITEGGAAGHMAHPFDLPNVKTGRDLKNIFEKAATSLNTNPGAVKIDGVNSSIRLVTLDGVKQFVMDRGSKKELDIKGITKDDLLNRFGEGHGMIKVGGEVLDMFNTALPQIESDLKALGAWEDPNILFNMEYVSGKTNVQDYGSNFVAIHGLNRIENKEVQGKRKMLTKRISSEISYSKDALQSLLDNLAPIAKKQGFEVYGSVPTKMKKKPNFNSALSQNYSVEFTEEVKTQTLSKWLDEVSAIPKDEFIFITRDNTKKKVGAVSKQVYQLILNGENVDGLFDGDDKKKAIDGFITYLATEKLGDEILKALDSPMGSVEDHEGVVIRDEKITSIPFKITGKFILGGLISDF